MIPEGNPYEDMLLFACSEFPGFLLCGSGALFHSRTPSQLRGGLAAESGLPRGARAAKRRCTRGDVYLTHTHVPFTVAVGTLFSKRLAISSCLITQTSTNIVPTGIAKRVYEH